MGLSEYARTGIVDGVLRNQPFVVPVVCASLYDNDPVEEDGSSAATYLVGTEEARSQVTCAAAVDGEGSSTGDPAEWVVTESTTATYVGFYDALTSGNWLGSVRVDQPTSVADGDTVKLLTFSLGLS